jgi:hypothetical protein
MTQVTAALDRVAERPGAVDLAQRAGKAKPPATRRGAFSYRLRLRPSAPTVDAGLITQAPNYRVA